MNEVLLLDAGSGGLASQRLIEKCFLRFFSNPWLDELDDAAVFPAPGASLVMSTDSYTVAPAIFPGGSIGSLAANGTMNDVAMRGGRPRVLSCGFVLEEGLPLADLERIARDLGAAAAACGARIVTGDTKVVPRGACDGIFINTTGVGELMVSPAPGAARASPGDAVLVSGSLGDHGLAIVAARENFSFLPGLVSDCACLAPLALELLENLEVHTLRDPTRGGLATALNEIAASSGTSIEIEENALPVHGAVRDGCAILGLDPLYLANEGKLLCILPAQQAQAALAIMRRFPEGREAAIIGRVCTKKAQTVTLQTPIGGRRVLPMLEGDPVPRIC